MLLNRLRTFYHPERFQGWGKKKNYFEGWYFKLLSAESHRALAIIPGVAIDDTGTGHSFIQILDGKAKTSQYFTFPIDSFKASVDEFQVSIENNHFSDHSIILDHDSFRGSLEFGQTTPWPVTIISPGIMGPYAFAPFMECYHGIVSMDHSISGSITLFEKEMNFTNGRGYIEKDWGRSFPSAYFWMQSNHFSKPGISFKCSVAKIPWLKNSFVGFIAGLWIDKKLIQFTTYNRSKLIRSFADLNRVEIIIENPNHILNINAMRSGSTELASPILGAMKGKIEESMTSEINIELIDKKRKKTIIKDTGINAGLEVAGIIDEIIV